VREGTTTPHLRPFFAFHQEMSSGAPSNANETCVGPSSETAGKASSCAGCPNQSACASGANKQPETIGLGIVE
jgi:hypothetical protein